MSDVCRALYISEILTVILDNLIDHKRSLSHLAACSKAICDPALDVLWAEMHSFAPLIPLLPENVQDLWVSSPPKYFHEVQLSLCIRVCELVSRIYPASKPRLRMNGSCSTLMRAACATSVQVQGTLTEQYTKDSA